ncbi:GntR family transcriptional regulator [Actibacterium pelagium]|uniref:GntR family transcriptional regulator n=1 Tax=Actibacterium pelagium TaxID=2029103 RepID=A0A917AFC0_9RHOB|nr:GntR family transcriptional regulator [Actibacterium pelagium]GGE47632.1 GntR family transcriptional regulator [Actibacterium pelagium]
MERRRADIIAEELEERIFDGTFPDGARLDEVRLAEKFGVSRTPLREALQRLARSGLVELIPRRGAFVRQPGPVELMEMFEVMAEVEAVCGRLAAMRISDEALKDLHDANVKCQAAINALDPDTYYIENERFHRIIYQQSGNSFLASEASSLHRRLKPFRRQQLRLRGRMKQSMAEHEAILNALENGASEEAANALRGHVAIQGEKFHSLMATLKSAAE